MYADKIIITLPTEEPETFSLNPDPKYAKPEKREINLFKVSNIEFDDVHYEDFPDFCDAFISSADCDGESMTEDELAELNEKHPEFVWEKLFDKLF